MTRFSYLALSLTHRAALVAGAILLAGAAPAAVEPPPPTCLSVVTCTGATAGCIKVPTSLPAVGSPTVSSGWDSAGGSCGSARKYKWNALLRVPCGPPLAGAACP